MYGLFCCIMTRFPDTCRECCMSTILKLRGGAALSQFRLEKLLAAAQEAGLPEISLKADSGILPRAKANSRLNSKAFWASCSTTARHLTPKRRRANCSW
jgi:hypothetical protein